jgi:FkbM family methyltransferase
MNLELVHWHTFDVDLVSADSVVVDLGANLGHFASEIVGRYGCTVHAVEASPDIFEHLQKTEGIHAFHYAMAGNNGTVELSLSDNILAATIFGENSSEGNDRKVSVEGIDLPTLMERHGIDHIDLLKIDIEGAEIAMLESCPDEVLMKIGQITAEFHDFCGLVPNADVERVISRLQQLGFGYVRMSRIGHQDTWLVNRHLHPVSPLQLAFSRYVIRSWWGVRRVFCKLVYGDDWARHFAP